MEVDNRIPKPQLKFDIAVDNSYNPFVPLNHHQFSDPNILRLQTIYNNNPYAYRFVPISQKMSPYLLESFPHPYLKELNTIEYPETIISPPIKSQPFSQAMNVISTPIEYLKAKQELESATELAVDLEHHAYRSYQGFTCLVQISTRTKDYIFDVLTLRSMFSSMHDVI